MDTTLDADLELLSATARRHLHLLGPRTSVHLSAAVDALTDPLVPPHLSGVDDAATRDLAEVLRAVRGRLLHAAQHTQDVQPTLTLALAARELACALATLPAPPTGPTGPEVGEQSHATSHGDAEILAGGSDGEPARAGR